MLKEILEHIKLNESTKLFWSDKNLLGKIVKYDNNYWKVIEANRTPDDLLFVIKSLDEKDVKAFCNPNLNKFEFLDSIEDIVIDELSSTINMLKKYSGVMVPQYMIVKNIEDVYEKYLIPDNVKLKIKKGDIVWGLINKDLLRYAESVKNFVEKNLGLKCDIIEYNDIKFDDQKWILIIHMK